MIKKLILASTVIFSMNAFAECARPVVIQEETLTPNELSIKELRLLKKELIKYRDDIDYTYYYTLTHNRIAKKSFEYMTNDKITEMKNSNKNNPERLIDIQNKETQFKNNLDQSLVNINNKTLDMKKQKLQEVDNQIEEINELIRKKASFPKK